MLMPRLNTGKLNGITKLPLTNCMLHRLENRLRIELLQLPLPKDHYLTTTLDQVSQQLAAPAALVVLQAQARVDQFW